MAVQFSALVLALVVVFAWLSTTVTAESIFGSNVGLIANEERSATAHRSPRAAGRTCGRSNYPDAGNMDLPRPRIVGGQEAREYEFPWQVSMQLNGYHHRCGGSIVAPSWVLTAAHCIGELTHAEIFVNLTIIVGAHKLDDTASPVRHVFKIVNYTIGKFNPETYANDIWLLELNGSITFNENVTSICLPDPTDTFVNQKSVASGWGATFFGSHTAPNTLLYTTLNTSSNADCDSVFIAKYGEAAMTPSTMCTRDNVDDRQRDTCQGDSGGPLAVKGADGLFTLAGIVSSGINCSAGFPGIYTRVSYYVDSVYQVTGVEPPATVPTNTTTTTPRNSAKSATVASFTMLMMVFLVMMSYLMQLSS